MKPRLARLGAECTVSNKQELMIASCCLSPMRRNSVFEVLRVTRLADIQEDIGSGGEKCCSQGWIGKSREQVAQLSQRDRAAGWVGCGQKWKTGTGIQHCADIIGLSSSTVT